MEKQHDMLFSPKFYMYLHSKIIYSLSSLTTNHNFSVNIVSDHISFTHDSKLCFCATIRNGTSFLNGSTIQNPEYALTSSLSCHRSITFIHKWLAHIEQARLKRLLENAMANGLHINSNTAIPPICEPCIAAKQHRTPFPKGVSSWASKPLDLIVSDIHGPLPVWTPSGHWYWITFTDDCTRYWCVDLLKTKDEAFEAYWSYKAFVENQANSKVRWFRDDKGGEYVGHKWNQHFQHQGIIHEHTTRGTSQQNRISEQTNRTLIEGTIALLQQAHLPTTMWGDALWLLVRIINATPTLALPDKTPYEAWHGHKPNLGMLCTFGCTAYVHVQKDKRNGLQPRSQKCIYLGFEDGYKGWWCLDPIMKHIIISQDIVFNESKFPGLSTTSNAEKSLLPVPTPLPREVIALPEAQPDLDLNAPEVDHNIPPHAELNSLEPDPPLPPELCCDNR